MNWHRLMALVLLTFAVVGLLPTAATHAQQPIEPITAQAVVTDDQEVHVDVIQPHEVQAVWAQVPVGVRAVPVSLNEITLRVTNSGTETAQFFSLFTITANGSKQTYASETQRVVAGGAVDTLVPLGRIVPALDALRSPGSITVETTVWDDQGTQYIIGDRPLAFHGSSNNPHAVVIYREAGLREQLRTLTFLDNPELSRSLAAELPEGQSPEHLTSFTIYDGRDAILSESAEEPDPAELEGALPLTDGPNVINVVNKYMICAEWNVALLDNNPSGSLKEDYGLHDGGWRARGARVNIRQGTHDAEVSLNKSGCVEFVSPNSGDIKLWFYGSASLLSGTGANTLNYVKYDGQFNTNLTASAVIKNPQPGAVYRPEISGWDAFGVLSYVMQDRLNGGVQGKTLNIVQGDCNGTNAGGGCATFINGKSLIFLDDAGSDGWHRKFIIAHEWGHMVLAWDANYANDCSFGNAGHGFKTKEYGSCAAMEGWAHFASLAAWNNPREGDNPNAAFVSWSGANMTVFDAESGTDPAYCFTIDAALCGKYGYEMDWMRQWWDYYTNDIPGSIGVRPSMAQLFKLVDDTSWSGTSGTFNVSHRLESALSGDQRTRWIDYKCWNGIDTRDCK